MSVAGEGRIFGASWDWVVRAVSWFGGAFLLCVVIAGIAGGVHAAYWGGGYSIAAILGAILLLSWLFAPVRYVLTDSELIVETHGPALRFSLKQVLGAQVVSQRRFFGVAIRCGNGGLFGIYGLYWSRKIGFFHCWCTRTRPLVVVGRRNGWPLVISPDSPEEFVATLGARKA